MNGYKCHPPRRTAGTGPRPADVRRLSAPATWPLHQAGASPWGLGGWVESYLPVEAVEEGCRLPKSATLQNGVIDQWLGVVALAWKVLALPHHVDLFRQRIGHGVEEGGPYFSVEQKNRHGSSRVV